MNRQKHFLVTLAAGLILFSCAKNVEAPPTEVDANAIRTEAVSTFASSLTETLIPSPTTIFTLTLPPTATETPSGETPVPQNTCYNLLFIKDVTIPDGTFLKDNETFTKTWQVQNNGACAWAPGFTFSHVGGDPMRGKTLVLSDPIPVGAKREISVQMVAPAGQSGLVQGSWRMADSSGAFFGDTLTVNITVGNILTPSATTNP
jgi:hypothetical protein